MENLVVKLDEAEILATAKTFVAGPTALRLDEGESVFFARELEHLKAQEFETEYPELRCRALIPVSTEADPADTRITYREYDKVGLAKLIRDYSDDLPRVDATGKEVTAEVRSIGASYGYNKAEIAAAQKTGRNLEQRRVEAAREAILRLENRLAFFGDTARGLASFLKFATVPEVSLPADGTGSSKAWTAKTADQILRDLNLVVNSIPEATGGVETPDTLILPRAAYHAAATRRIGRDSSMTVLKFFIETNPYIKSMANIEVLNEIATAGAGDGTRMMAYRRSPMKVTLEIPQDFDQEPAQARNLEWVVNCTSRLGGCIWYKPLSAAYADGL